MTKGVGKDDVTYVFLMEDTAKGAGLSGGGADEGNGGGEQGGAGYAGGQCRLYETRGSGFEYVSVISGISAAAAIRIAGEIERPAA